LRRARPEAKCALARAQALVDDCIEPQEGTTAYEEDVGGVDLDEVLVRMLATALRGHIGHAPLDDLQQGLLDPFP
jgi:hypothetical protein